MTLKPPPYKFSFNTFFHYLLPTKIESIYLSYHEVGKDNVRSKKNEHQNHHFIPKSLNNKKNETIVSYRRGQLRKLSLIFTLIFTQIFTPTFTPIFSLNLSKIQYNSCSYLLHYRPTKKPSQSDSNHRYHQHKLLLSNSLRLTWRIHRSL